MKIALVKPPFYSLFGLNIPKMKTYPLNLICLATYLRRESEHEAVIVDGDNLEPPAFEKAVQEDPDVVMRKRIPEMVRILNTPDHKIWERLMDRIMASAPDMVGITCNSGNMDAVKLMTAKLKARGLPVVLGGSHPTVAPEQSLAYTGADFVIMGEGETSLVALLDAAQGSEEYANTPSLAWTTSASVRRNPQAPLIADLDSLPIPDRSFISREEYFGNVIMTGRGCPFDCAYCASRNIWGKRVRLRSVDNFVGELEALKRDTLDAGSAPGAWVMKIVDDTFTVSKRRTLEILQRIIEQGLNRFEFTGGVRADSLDETLTARMAQANFKRVTLGVESGSPKILSLIRKHETNEDVKRGLALLRRAGIKSHAFFMIGFPGETLEDVELSKRLILDAQPDYVEVNMVTPYPGTDLFPMLMETPPESIDRWHRWFHQGMATHSNRLGYDLDAAYADFAEFAREYNVQTAAS